MKTKKKLLVKDVLQFNGKVDENREIFIDQRYINSPHIEFIQNYDLQFVKFIERERRLGEVSLTKLIDAEKKFLALLLHRIKKRNDQILKLKENILTEFLKLNNLKIFDLPWLIAKDTKELEWDSFMAYKEELGKYEDDHEKMTSAIKTEFNSFNFKVSFLLVKASKLGYTVDVQDSIKFNEISSDEPDHIIDPIKTKGTEKLIFLQELGIIDFMLNSNPDLSLNKVAMALSAITGERHIYPALSAMIGEKHSNTKSPYFSTKKAPIIQDQLTQWGFKLSYNE